MDRLKNTLHPTLVDALAQETLTLADLGGLTGRELDALFLAGQKALAIGQSQDAIIYFSLATKLMPFQARFWRALGIALHTVDEMRSAVAAYKASLALDIEHDLTKIYLAEALCLIGRPGEALSQLGTLSEPLSVEARARLDLFNHVHARALPISIPAVPSILPVLDLVSEAEELTLTDGRVLPLDTLDLDAVSFTQEALTAGDGFARSETRPGAQPGGPVDYLIAPALSAATVEATDASTAIAPTHSFSLSFNVTQPFITSLAPVEATPSERTSAFRLRLTTASLDEEVTLTRASLDLSFRAQTDVP